MTQEEFEQRVGWNGGADRTIDNWRIIDIHIEPIPFEENNEMDFYCCNETKVILLRIRNREKEQYSIHRNEYHSTEYWISELPIPKVDDDLILKALSKFE